MLNNFYSDGKDVNVFDVAEYILQRISPITPMKMHALLYYCQAWSLTWNNESLFPEKIEAWVGGPVVSDFYETHKGVYKLTIMCVGNAFKLSQAQTETIDSILIFYGHKSLQWLVDLIRGEEPYIEARLGLLVTERGNNEVSPVTMKKYYSSL